MAKKTKTYDFIDLFAGIGGFHVAFNKTKRARCVFSSEWNPAARETYRHFFNDEAHLFTAGEKFFNKDITSIKGRAIKTDIPDFNILCGGFPCQPFSQVGQKKGFSDTRGTLFFNVEEIIAQKKPDVFFLENVRGLLTHKSGDTMRTILLSLFGSKSSGGLGYHMPTGFDGKPAGYFYVKASDYGVPQHRPRVFIIGFKDKNAAKSFSPPPPADVRIKDPGALGRILGHPNSADAKVYFDKAGTRERFIGFTLRCGGKGSGILDRRNWEHYWVRKSPRADIKPEKITEEMGLRLLGFPEHFRFPTSVRPTQRMRQLGNSVAVTAVEQWGLAIIKSLDSVL